MIWAESNTFDLLNLVAMYVLTSLVDYVWKIMCPTRTQVLHNDCPTKHKCPLAKEHPSYAHFTINISVILFIV